MNGRWSSIAPIRLVVAAFAVALAIAWPTLTAGAPPTTPGSAPSVVAPIYPPFPAPLPNVTTVTEQGHGLWDDAVSGARAAWDRLHNR